MSDKNKNPEVIEAVLIDDDGHPADENAFERITREGAGFLDAVADTASFITPETAESLHQKAESVRRVSRAAVAAADSGKKLLGSVGGVVDKLGLRDRFVMVQRDRPRAR